MEKIWKFIFIFVLIWSIYHFLRDILQIMGIQNFFTTVWHWTHEWCRPLCDYITLPLDIFQISATMIVLRRNRIGALGIAVLLSLLVALLMWLTP